jgi:hypothetical protein
MTNYVLIQPQGSVAIALQIKRLPNKDQTVKTNRLWMRLLAKSDTCVRVRVSAGKRFSRDPISWTSFYQNLLICSDFG